MRRLAAPAILLAPAVLALAGCDDSPPPPEPTETEIPEDLANQAGPAVGAAVGIGTPMEERIATLGLLNKRNNLSQDIELKPGESRRVGDVIVRLAACERTAPWEMPKETGAFVQVLVRQAGNGDNWDKVFSGWLFKQSPSLNVVEHPVYDVWVKDCAMSFPGGAAPAAAPSPSASPAPAVSASTDE